MVIIIITIIEVLAYFFVQIYSCLFVINCSRIDLITYKHYHEQIILELTVNFLT